MAVILRKSLVLEIKKTQTNKTFMASMGQWVNGSVHGPAYSIFLKNGKSKYDSTKLFVFIFN